MPFKPLPGNFLEFLSHLEEVPDPLVVDLGSGDGAFGRLLDQSGIQVIELDCSSLATGTSIPLRGDALHPPFLSRSLDCLLAGNLWRHLLVQNPGGDFLTCWLDLLKPGGTLFIFEDEPDTDDRAARNYRDFQSFLAQLMPDCRGSLLSRDYFLEWAHGLIPAQNWHCGTLMNQNKPNSTAVCQMLTANWTTPIPGGSAGELLAAIERFGLSYGSYWWASAKID